MATVLFYEKIFQIEMSKIFKFENFTFSSNTIDYQTGVIIFSTYKTSLYVIKSQFHNNKFNSLLFIVFNCEDSYSCILENSYFEENNIRNSSYV